MVNYQLQKTNVLLGGQMKYDLIVSGDNIVDIYITPISESVPFNKYIKQNLLNYSHKENIKKYYTEISSSFYKDFLHPNLASIYPLATTKNLIVEDNTYKKGIKIPKYSPYDKKYEYLCPVWIEQIQNESWNVEFEIQILNLEGKILTTKLLKFSDEIKKYLYTYIKDVGLTKGQDWVFDINKQNCIVDGLNVKTGLCETCKLIGFFKDLTFRERPLLEFNNMIINELNKNHLIAKQLFNFNLCFNYDDILNPFLFKELVSENKLRDNCYLKIITKIDGVALEERDIFTNHEYIKKISSTPPKLQINKKNNELQVISGDNDSDKLNVLDYLKDYQFIDLIDKNKLIQNTCHWCLSENPVEHFNFYDGFSLFRFIENDSKEIEIIDIPYYNGETANLIAKNLSNYCYPYWCNCYSVFEKNIIRDIIYGKYDHLFSHFAPNKWVKNIKYDFNKINQNTNIENIDVVQLKIESTLWDEVATFIKNESIGWKYYEIKVQEQDILIFYRSSDNFIKVVILFTNENDILYQNFMILKDTCGDLKPLFELLSNPYNAQQITLLFENGLIMKKAHGPSLQLDEIEYYKSDSHKTVIRNLGKIKPYFIKDDDIYQNYEYQKYTFEELKEQKLIDDYSKYLNTNYEPRYPSLNYFAIKRKDIDKNKE